MEDVVALKLNAWVAAVLSIVIVHVLVTVRNVPRLKPTVFVLSGPSAVSVALTSPPVSVVNENVLALEGMSVPEWYR
jgi:hypothetical protein